MKMEKLSTNLNLFILKKGSFRILNLFVTFSTRVNVYPCAYRISTIITNSRNRHLSIQCKASFSQFPVMRTVWNQQLFVLGDGRRGAIENVPQVVADDRHALAVFEPQAVVIHKPECIAA